MVRSMGRCMRCDRICSTRWTLQGCDERNRIGFVVDCRMGLQDDLGFVSDPGEGKEAQIPSRYPGPRELQYRLSVTENACIASAA